MYFHYENFDAHLTLGSLRQDIEKRRETHKFYSEPQILERMRQMLSAVVYMHDKTNEKRRMVHRDIKPENFLIFDGTIKICDFGISREIFTQKSVFDTKNL